MFTKNVQTLHGKAIMKINTYSCYILLQQHVTSKTKAYSFELLRLSQI